MSATPPDDEATLRARLTHELGEVFGSDLRAHLLRDAVLVVAPGLSVVACAEAIARDDADTVRAWLTRGALRRPDAHERATWPDDPDRRWLALVVAPFVLVQELVVAAS